MVANKTTSNGVGEYKATLTRERFLFHEMRTTAKLMTEGMTDKDVVDKIVEENLFQYPTEKSIKRMARLCVKRLKMLNSQVLIEAIANQPFETAKQICLYAIMKQSYLVWDFMITVIGEKYRLKDTTFGRIDLNVYFMRLQEQNKTVAGWSDLTITVIKRVLMNILIENEYIDDSKSERINPVWLNSILEDAIRDNKDTIALPAFNCFD